MDTKLLYSTAYHAQTNGQSERTNQTTEIVLRHYIANLSVVTKWPDTLPRMQGALNNSTNRATGSSPTQLMYGTTIGTTLTALSEPQPQDFSIRIDVKLHHGYSIPMPTSPKYGQQYVGPFTVKRRIGRLAYELDIPTHWRVHPVFSVVWLEPYPNPDPFNRPEPERPGTVFVEGDTETEQSYELDRILDKRIVIRRKKRITEYLVRWKGWPPEYDQWLKDSELSKAQDLVEDYEKSFELHPSALDNAESNQ